MNKIERNLISWTYLGVNGAVQKKSLMDPLVKEVLSYLGEREQKSGMTISQYWKDMTVDLEREGKGYSSVNGLIDALLTSLGNIDNPKPKEAARAQEMLRIIRENNAVSSLESPYRFTSVASLTREAIKCKKIIVGILSTLKSSEIGSLREATRWQARPHFLKDIFNLAITEKRIRRYLWKFCLMTS
jgi:hypothetical protein